MNVLNFVVFCVVLSIVWVSLNPSQPQPEPYQTKCAAMTKLAIENTMYEFKYDKQVYDNFAHYFELECLRMEKMRHE